MQKMATRSAVTANADRLKKEASFLGVSPTELKRIKIKSYRFKYKMRHIINGTSKIKTTTAESSAKYRAMKYKSMPKWANKDYIKLFYKLAKFEAERIGKKVQIDHIVPLTSDKVCGLHCEHNLQLLTATANREKHNKFTI